MAQLSPEAFWQISESKLVNLLDKGLLFSRMRLIRFYAPSFMPYKTSHYRSSPTDFPTISVTGKACALKCKHCEGKVLETMYPAATPEKLFRLCSRLKADGALGCLISGGCQPNGAVPLERFVEAIERVKRELSLTVFVHTGIIDFFMAEKLKNAGVDAALIDIIGADETINEIYGLNLTVSDYDASLRALSEAGVVFVPHVIVGLHYGQLKGELNALELIAKYKPSALVIIAFMPIRGTAMANVAPPKPIDIVRVTATARVMFPETPLVLGCMRPKGRHRIETDVLAIKAGVNAMAFPTEEAIVFAQKQGYKTVFSSFCCSHVYADVTRE